MDPMNSPTPTPTPTPAPDAPAPVAPDPMSAGGFDNPAPVAPVAPAAPVTPVAPVSPDLAASGLETPNPVTPPVNPVVRPTGAPVQPPVNPVVRPTGLGVTDPIMMPEKPAAPDPVEEELKAPMKAAGPVPGSIGSAISGPASVPGVAADSSNDPFAGQPTNPTPSVAFNDPAVQPAPAQPAKKKTSKSTLIALIIVVVMVVIALAGVLVMQLMG